MENKVKEVFIFLGIFYSCYLVFSSFVEPGTWFGGKYIESLGNKGHVALILAPFIITSIFYLYQYWKKKRFIKYQGIKSISTGSYRIDAFEALRSRAKSKIVITGIGMTNIVHYSLDSLRKQGKYVDIDFIMIDPDYISNNAEYCKILENSLGVQDLAIKVLSTFGILKSFCLENNNANRHVGKKMALYVYNCIPTNSTTIIDPYSANGELLIEFFIFKGGLVRPRFNISKLNKDNFMSDSILESYQKLISDNTTTKQIV
ncbi:MAG: hypothetical protein KA536_21050 [Saprospiraceae bacterium]|nr:hypothetical protein [Saprospiraceae bacterium]